MNQTNVAEKIFLENEREANQYASRCLFALASVAALSWILNLVGIFKVPARAMNIGMAICILLFLVPIFVCKRAEGTEQWLKYLMLGGCVAGITVLAIAMPKHAVLAWVAPILLSCHYYSRRLTMNILMISVVCMWIAIYLSMFVGEGDPNLLGGKKIAEAVLTPTVFKETTIFFSIPRAAILIGLCSVVVTVDKRTRHLLLRQAEDSADRQRIETELNVAASIQLSMLPNHFPAFPERTDFDIYATMNPAKEVGGDFYDFYLVDEDHLGITIADVSGKGVPAALFMSRGMALLRTHAMTGQSPAEVLRVVNEELCRNNEEFFVTVWLGVLELSSGKLVYANAGHSYPLVRKDGVYSYVKEVPDFVLGGLEGMRYQNRELMLSPGDMFFHYTDGVPETFNKEEEQFGLERLLQCMETGAKLSPEELLVFLQKEIDAFANGAEQFDDITMIAVEYKPGDALAEK